MYQPDSRKLVIYIACPPLQDMNLLFVCLFFRIFVNMDDNIIEHYSNHSAFLIEISEIMCGQFQVTLMEL
jgi:hypothetical protein